MATVTDFGSNSSIQLANTLIESFSNLVDSKKSMDINGNSSKRRRINLRIQPASSICSDIDKTVNLTTADVENPKPKRSRKYDKAKCWFYFSKITTHTAICNICQKTVKTSNNTSNAWRHLERNHAKEYTSLLEECVPNLNENLYVEGNNTFPNSTDDHATNNELTNVFIESNYDEYAEENEYDQDSLSYFFQQDNSNDSNENSSKNIPIKLTSENESSQPIHSETENGLNITSVNKESRKTQKSKKCDNKSKCWSYFTKITTHSAICTLCQKTVLTSNNTSNAWSHLERNHAAEYTQILGESGSTSSSFGLNIEKHDSREFEIQEKIIFMIVKDFQPLCIVTDEGFKNLIRLAFPNFFMPSRQIMANLLEMKYSSIRVALLTELTFVKNISVTADVWSAKFNQKSFLTITAHYMIDNSSTPKSIVLSTVDLYDQSLTSDHLSRTLYNVLNEWKIKEKVVAVVINCVHKQLISSESTEPELIGCNAHLIKLATKNAIEEDENISNMIQKFRRVFKHFKKSGHARAVLDQIQEEIGSNEIPSLQGNKSWWNSQYYMLEHLVSIKECVNIAAYSYDKLERIENHEWQIAKDLLNILENLEAATRSLCGDSYASASYVIPIIRSCVNHLSKIAIKSHEAIRVRARLVSSLNDMFSSIESNDILRLSTLLDPRFKVSGFSKKSYADEAVTSLLELIDKTDYSDFNSTSNLFLNTSSKTNNKEKIDFLDDILTQDINKRNDSVNVNTSQDEIMSYLNLGLITVKENSIDWWLNRRNMFPRLANLALKYLIIPATATSSERIFSESGYILNKKRSLLSSDHRDMIIFLNNNFKL